MSLYVGIYLALGLAIDLGTAGMPRDWLELLAAAMVCLFWPLILLAILWDTF